MIKLETTPVQNAIIKGIKLASCEQLEAHCPKFLTSKIRNILASPAKDAGTPNFIKPKQVKLATFSTFLLNETQF